MELWQESRRWGKDFPNVDALMICISRIIRCCKCCQEMQRCDSLCACIHVYFHIAVIPCFCYKGSAKD